MTTATPTKTNKSTKATHRPTCKHCKARFRTTSAVKVYCTTQCQKEATQKKRRVSRIDRATNSAFFYHLAYECERAGTLQILSFHSVESLVALYEVYKLKLKANKYGTTKDYEISHICPVRRDSDSIGLYHAENLVVVPTKLNRQHGTQHFGHGLSIAYSALQPKHMVEKGASRKDTVARIIKYLGENLVTEVVRAAKIQTTQRHKLMGWLHDHLDPTLPEQRTHLDNLDEMSTIALSALKLKIEGKEGSGFTIKTTILTPSAVFVQELERHSTHRPELIEVLDVLCKRVAPFTAFHQSRTTLSEDEQQAVFNVLHGASVESIRYVLTDYIQRIISAKDHADPLTGAEQRIPPCTPIRFNVQRPTKVLVAFKDFAAELDAYDTQNIVPVLFPVHTLAYEFDPVPWG
ncbi:hypothetical protein IMW75_03320 [Pseudomonas gregormendelii]|uniref:HNH endonuclease n=1 Tax=Pseudomonas gregormendelii TaxID=1628277 RepID=A0ABS3ACY0_9PSED|nr:hypothetical protein [Pseudomonas gregormendelii]MBN3964315.1 hypothetical protein [Pseudomonas gregormendelii]